MEHTNIVSAHDLEAYAERRESESVVPELIWLLINQSVLDLTACRIPYGDAINQPGLDGVVETAIGYRQYVPKQRSVWEIGTGANPQGKATSDFRKRTRDISPIERGLAAYVFATPRGAGQGGWTEPAQRRWTARRASSGWREIRILDATQIADWLREFPALGKWLLKRMGSLKVVGDLSTPAEHWDNLEHLVAQDDRSMPPQVFLTGRDQAVEELKRLFRGEANLLLLAIESEEDAEDFISAFMASLEPTAQASLGNRCLFIREADAWMTFAALKTPHVLVAHPRLDIENDGQMQTAAKKNGHAIVIPVSGTWSHGSASLVQLRSPSGQVLETTFIDAGFQRDRAKELGGAGALSLASLKRHLLGLGDLPPYATWENARILAQANLFGKWDGSNDADRAAIQDVLGKAYGEWIEAALAETLRADTPLIQRAEKWKIVSRGEAWSALGPRLTNADLQRFASMVALVLGDIDPKLDLPPDERLWASTEGAQRFSRILREGTAETLALLGSRPAPLTSCSPGMAAEIAGLVVRDLLARDDWRVWASLNEQLPLLAEASPSEFLSALDRALVRPILFQQLFKEEGNGIWSSSYASGLLWALEGLAWDPAHLVRVTLLLGELASIDPGGNWTNRPANSLNHIFLPWFPQTAASNEVKRIAVEKLLQEQPTVGWRLLVSLLPRSTATSTGTHRPTWRSIPIGWKEGVTNREYSQQIEMYSELAVGIAAADVQKLSELIEHLPELPIEAHNKTIEHLRSSAVLSLPESSRLKLWESLTDLANKHKRFATAPWALPPDVVGNIVAAAHALMPTSPFLLHQRLFSERDFDLYESDEEFDFEAQQKELDQRRVASANDIYEVGGLAGVLEFARQVDSPRKLGGAFAILGDASTDNGLLPDLLTSTDAAFRSFVEAYAWVRHGLQGWSWADELMKGNWSDEDRIDFLVSLPFGKETWRRAEERASGAEMYWRKVSPNAWALKEDTDLLEAAQKLVEFGRPHHAITCVYLLVHKDATFPAEVAVTALMRALTVKPERGGSDSQQVLAVIQWLQKRGTDEKQLFDIEWSYLPILDELTGGEPKTIERLLATDPSFYVQVISMVFRSEKDSDNAPNRVFTEAERTIAQNAYRLLKRWRRIPGSTDIGELIPDRFILWVEKMKELADESGHLTIALTQFGELLAYAPADPDGLWISVPVAAALDARDAEPMRRGFSTGLFNLRGVYTVDGGQGERALATAFRQKATLLIDRGFARLAATVNGVAEAYETDAAREQSAAQNR